MEIDIGAIIILAIVFFSLIATTIVYYYKYTNLLNKNLLNKNLLNKELNLIKLQSLMNFKVFKPAPDNKDAKLIMPVSEFLDLYNYVDNQTS